MSEKTDDEHTVFSVWRVLRQLARTLNLMAGRNIAHNDIKVDNVCVRFSPADKKPVATLIDFGLATKYGTKTFKYPFMKKYWNLFQWMAPELLAGKTCSIESDVYSLGKLLHFLHKEFSWPLPPKVKKWTRAAVGRNPAERPKVELLLYETKTYFSFDSPEEVEYKVNIRLSEMEREDDAQRERNIHTHTEIEREREIDQQTYTYRKMETVTADGEDIQTITTTSRSKGMFGYFRCLQTTLLSPRPSEALYWSTKNVGFYYKPYREEN